METVKTINKLFTFIFLLIFFGCVSLKDYPKSLIKIPSSINKPVINVFVISTHRIVNVPLAKSVQSTFTPDFRFLELQRSLGEYPLGRRIVLNNATKEFQNESQFINFMKKQDTLYMVYHTCNLDNYPVTDQGYHWRAYATTVRLLLFDGKDKVLDFRDTVRSSVRIYDDTNKKKAIGVADDFGLLAMKTTGMARKEIESVIPGFYD